MQHTTATSIDPANLQLALSELFIGPMDVASRSSSSDGDQRFMLAQQHRDSSFRIAAGLKREMALKVLGIVEWHAAQQVELDRARRSGIRRKPIR